MVAFVGETSHKTKLGHSSVEVLCCFIMLQVFSGRVDSSHLVL